MPRRAMWKGVLRVGDERVPVKLYAAVEDTAVHFHLLHAQDGARVQQRMVSAETGKEVPPEQVHKGFELEPGVFVLLEREDLAALAPKPSRDIALHAFVPDTAIGSAWFERPYHLGPDGAAKPYQAFARALEAEGKQGIARWVMRGKTYTGALRARDGILTLIVLRDREEVLPIPELKPVSTRDASKQELALAEQLVTSLQSELNLAQFHDEQRERVREYVEKKAQGKRVRLVHPKTKKPAGDSLASVLKASIQHARSGQRKEQKSA